MKKSVFTFILMTLAGHAQTPSFSAAARLNGIRSGSLVANGVDAGTGGFQFAQSLLRLSGLRSLDFAIAYDSIFISAPGALGPGWTHPFEASIGGSPTGAVTVRWNSVRHNSFAFTSTGNPYRPLDEAVQYDVLTRNTNGSWQLVRQDGSIYEFESSGRLRRIGNKYRQFLEMVYAPGGRLTGVREPVANRLLSFTYQLSGTGLLESVRDAADRTVFFEYDGNGRLAATRAPVVLGEVFVPLVFIEPRPIPDNNPAGITLTFDISRTAPIGLVKLGQTSITHPRPADLRIFMISPQGTRHEVRKPLVTGGNRLNFEGMILGAFEDENPQGTWRVQVIDTASGSTGQVDRWNFIFSDPSDPVRFTYNASGLLSQADAPDGNRIFANLYDASRRIIAQDDGLDTNAPALFEYQATSGGGVRTIYRDRQRNVSILEHDAASRLISSTDPLGNRFSYAYNERGDRVRITDPLGRTAIFGYDASGNLTSAVNPAGALVSFEHDSDRNLIRVRDSLGKSSTFSYNSNSNLTRVTDALGNSDTKSYGANSQITGLLLSDGAGINYTYSNGMMTGVSHPAGHGNARSEYDAIGRPLRLIDRAGGVTEYTYDTRGNVLTEKDPRGQIQSTSYDRLGRPYAQSDRSGAITFTAYDANGNRSRVTDPLGGVTRFEYDGEDRLVRVVDANGNASSIAYDAAGRMLSETDALGNTQTYEYDAAGQLISVRDAHGVVVLRQEYGDTGRVVAEFDALGHRWTTSYDSAGRTTSFRDPLGQTIAWNYDALDRPVSVVDAAGRTFRQEFHEDDVLASHYDGRGNRTRFIYGPANRLSTVEPPSGPVVNYRYDGRDRVVTQTHAGVTLNNSYDTGGRLTEVNRSGGGQTGPSAGYGYDANGNVTRVTNRSNPSSAGLRYSYDQLNRVTAFVNAAGDVLRYTYDPAGNLTALTYPDGRQVAYTYDKADRLLQVRDWAGRVTRYAYDRRGLITRIDLPNGTFRVMEYDRASRVTRRADMTPQGAVIVEYSYTYDATGNVTSIQSPRLPASGSGAATMTYDSNNRVATYNGATVTHDQRGNLTRGPVGASLANLAFDNANRLTAAGTAAYAYDEEDRLIGFSGPRGSVRLTVNPRGQPSAVIERIPSGASPTRYVYGAGLIYEETAGAIRVYHYDHRGNTVALTDDSGSVTGAIDYGPYGEILAQSGAEDVLFKFGGLFGVLTDPSGLNYMRFRWYSPLLKRFISQDAHFGDISSPATLNRYSYAANNPLNFTDPEGQFFNALAAAVGAVAGVSVALIVRGVERAATGRKFVEKGEEWAFVGELAGAAIGGGIAGACLGTCSAGALAFYGAAGGLAGNLVKQGVRIGGTAAFGGNSENLGFDAGDLVAETVLGGAFGALPAGKGAKALTAPLRAKALSRSVSGRGRTYMLMEFGEVGGEIGFKKALGMAAPPPPGLRQYGSDFLKDIGLGLLQSVLTSASAYGLNLGFSLASNDGGETPDNRTVESDARQSLYAGKKARFGEFIHWNLYHGVLSAAGRPMPNVPQSQLATF